MIYPGIEDDEVLNTGTSEDDHKTKECLQKGEHSQIKHKFDFFLTILKDCKFGLVKNCFGFFLSKTLADSSLIQG